MPAALLQACDAWVASEPERTGTDDLRRLRRAAIWTLFRSSGVRLVELAWRPLLGLPRLAVDERGNWTLHVIGNRDKERSIPLPSSSTGVLRAYRLARGLPEMPPALERVALVTARRAAASASGVCTTRSRPCCMR